MFILAKIFNQYFNYFKVYAKYFLFKMMHKMIVIGNANNFE